MPDRLEELEAQLRTLAGELDALRRRVELLEGPADLAAAPVGPVSPAARRRAAAAAHAPAPPGTEGPLADAATMEATAPLAGLALLVLAGAFVLRYLTDAGTLPVALGVGLGFCYAAGVLALALRAPRPVAAGAHALTTVLIGFPLLVEASTRFQLLGPASAGLLLAVLGGGVLGVAARRRLPWVAWLGTVATLATGLALAVLTGRLVPVALALVALGLAAAWLGYLLDWGGPRWPLAAAADLAVALAAARALAPASAEGTGLALLAAGALVLGYLASFAARTLYLGRSVVTFEVAQTAGVLLAGLGGVAFLASRAGAGSGALGVGTLVLAAACYGVAFAFVERRQQGSANFHFYGAVALAFTLAGTWLTLPAGARGAALAVLALAAAGLARARARPTLVLHAALLGLSAALASGLLLHADVALFATAAAPWPPLAPSALGVLACLAAAAVLSGLVEGRATFLERAPQLLLAATVALSLAGVLAGAVVALLGAPGPEADLGVVGTGRTAVLAGGAVLAAWIGRRGPAREAGWLAWPLLGVLGLKLLLEDLPRGRPATLVLSFAFSGAALMLVPRLRAARRAPATPPPG